MALCLVEALLVAEGDEHVTGTPSELEADLGLVRMVGFDLLEQLETSSGLVELPDIAVGDSQVNGALSEANMGLGQVRVVCRKLAEEIEAGSRLIGPARRTVGVH